MYWNFGTYFIYVWGITMNCKLDSVKVKTVAGVDIWGYGKDGKHFSFYRLFVGGRSIYNDVVYDIEYEGFEKFVKDTLEKFKKVEMMA